MRRAAALLTILTALVLTGARPEAQEATRSGLPSVAPKPLWAQPYLLYRGEIIYPKIERVLRWEGSRVVVRNGRWKYTRAGVMRFIATVTNCASGCTSTVSVANVNTLINASIAGDEILLQEGASYLGTIKLRTNTTVDDIVLRTGVTAGGAVLADSIFPDENVRIAPNPAQAAIGGGDGDCGGVDCEDRLATITPANNNEPAVYTVEPGNTGAACSAAPCIANNWHLKWLRFTGTNWGGGTLLHMGSWIHVSELFDGGSDTQNVKSEIPSNHTIEQIIIDGGVRGQQRGIAFASRNFVLKDSFLWNMEVGPNTGDGQPIFCHNTDGPGLIQNVYTHGGTESFMCGGDDSRVLTIGTVQAGSTATSIIFDTVLDLDTDIDKWIRCNIGGVQRTGQVDSVSGTTATIKTGHFPAAPSAGATCRWSINPKNITITKSWFTRDPDFREPAITTPTSLSVSAQPGGSLPASTAISYRIVARHLVAAGATFRSTASTIIICTTTSVNRSCSLNWGDVANVVQPHGGEYRVYRDNGDGTMDERFTVTVDGVGDDSSFVDDGSGTPTIEAVPTTIGNRWQAKNNGEFKNCVDCTVQGNYFSYMSNLGQSGHATLLSSMSQEDGDPSAVVSGILWRDNWMRYSIACMSISVNNTDSSYQSGTSERIHIINNLCSEIGPNWSDPVNPANEYAFAVGGGENAGTGEWNAIDFILAHNTVISNAGNYSGSFAFLLYRAGAQRTAVNFKMRDNIIWRGGSGMRALTPFFSDEGTMAWTANTSGAAEFVKNATNASGGTYPNAVNNYFPTTLELEAYFVNFGTGNYRCAISAPCRGTATDGTDVGANIDTIESFITVAISGDNSGAVDPPPPPPPPTTAPYNWTKAAMLDGSIDLTTRSLKVMLVGLTYVFDPDHTFIDMGGAADPVDARITGTTDQLLTGKTVQINTATNFAYFDANDATFTNVPTGQGVTGVIIYDDSGVATTSRLIYFMSVTYTTTGQDVTIQWRGPTLGGIHAIR